MTEHFIQSHDHLDVSGYFRTFTETPYVFVMKIDISVLDSSSSSDLSALIEVFEDVFEIDSGYKPSPEHLSRLLQQESFTGITAKIDGQVVGGLTLYVLEQYRSTKPLAYIYDFAVLTQYQRRGIGRQLIEFTRQYCRKRGLDEIFVQVEKVDLFALDFYRSTKPASEDPVVQFTYRLDEEDGQG